MSDSILASDDLVAAISVPGYVARILATRARVCQGSECRIWRRIATEQVPADARRVNALFHGEDAWNGRLKVMQTERLEWKRRADTADKDILKLVDRILETESQIVQRAIEAKIEKPEREKIVLVEKAAEPLPNVGRFEECVELALQFLSRPWDIYRNGSFAVRQTVVRLVFSQSLTFTPDGVYGTIKTTLPFKVLGGSSSKKCEMVLLEGIQNLSCDDPSYIENPIK